MFRRAVWIAVALAGLHCSRADAPDPRPTPARGVVARIMDVRGTAKVRPFGVREWRAARAGMELGAGDALRTWAHSAVELRYNDGMALTIQPDSHVEIDSPAETGVEGRIRFDAPAQDDTVLRAPNSRVEALPGYSRKGTVETTDDGVTILKQQEGRAVLRTERERIELDARQRVDVGKDGTTGPVKPLPAAPRLLSPSHHGVIAVPDPSRSSLSLAWSGVPAARGYRVRVHGDAAGAGPLVDRQVPAVPTTLLLDPLPVGRYYWEVAALAGGEEVWSDLATFTIRAAAAEAGPQLLIDRLTPQGNTVYVEGRTEEGARLTVNDETVGVDAQGRFHDRLVLPPSRRLLFRVTSAEGGETRRSVHVPAP